MIISYRYGTEYDIRDYGGVGDGKTDNTESFIAAFAAAQAGGGGIVVVADGQYLTGPVDLLSTTYLQVDDDAVLLGIADRNHYPDYPSAIIRCNGQEQTGIVGGGVIDGQVRRQHQVNMT